MVILWLMISDRARHELGSATLSHKCKVDLRQDALPFGHWMYLPFTFSVTEVILVPALPTLVLARLRFPGRYDHFLVVGGLESHPFACCCSHYPPDLGVVFSSGGCPVPSSLRGGSLSVLRYPPCQLIVGLMFSLVVPR